jgi:hypothetical protein
MQNIQAHVEDLGHGQLERSNVRTKVILFQDDFRKPNIYLLT